jgi:hypothetical protein
MLEGLNTLLEAMQVRKDKAHEARSEAYIEYAKSLALAEEKLQAALTQESQQEDAASLEETHTFLKTLRENTSKLVGEEAREEAREERKAARKAARAAN